MKILFADFEIAKYGGIIEHVTAKVKALKALGHEVDIVQITAAATTEARYLKKLRSLEDGSFSKDLKENSQNGGYEFDEATGYWKNNYYGFFLPPSNRIGAFEPNALERWRELVDDADLIIWNFAPTKSSIWGGTKFNFWHKFFDLPYRIAQMFIAHDAYFDVRASNISALRDKILFIETAHIAAYGCCENIGIPRILELNPRYIEDDAQLKCKKMSERSYDFFAAHVFKSMKRVDDLLRATAHLPEGLSTLVAGSGIEQAYMVAETKCKEPYITSRKRDPDIDEGYIGRKIWDVAEEHGMVYLGQIPTGDVNELLKDSRFAVDPSWASHYAKYCRTHINGFIIEAMLNGCYPVIRDYRGLDKNTLDLEDELFNHIRAVVIPHDATPKEFADALVKASEMSDEQYEEDVQYNFELVKELFNAKKNMQEILELVEDRELINDLEVGTDSEEVKRISDDIMTNFFGIEVPIEWEH